MQEVIAGTKKIIDKQVNEPGYLHNLNFNGISKGYFWSNENIDGYLSLADFTNKNRALCVTASGDQIFSLISKGITDIDTFDINSLTEYYVLGLKRALIIKYPYREFLKIMTILNNFYSNSSETVHTIILESLPFMEQKYRDFWSQIVDYNHQIQKGQNFKFSLFPMLFNCCIPVSFSIQNSPYLQDEVSYEQVRSKLLSCNISFQNVNVINLGKNYHHQYDFVLLSNILDFMFQYWQKWGYVELDKYLKSIQHLLTPEGILYLKYVFEYRMRNNNHLAPLFQDGSVVLNELTGFEIHELPCQNSIYTISDAIILKRGK